MGFTLVDLHKICFGGCLFNMQVWRKSVKGHLGFGPIGSSLSTGFQFYLSKCWGP